MPDSTNNHGGSWDLTIPAGEDTVDIVRDVGTLGVEVDLALTDAYIGGINVDTAGTTENEEGMHMGISYNVNDDVSIEDAILAFTDQALSVLQNPKKQPHASAICLRTPCLSEIKEYCQ